MVAAEVEALAAIGDGAHQHGLVRAEIVAGVGLRQFLAVVALDGHQVEDRGGEIADRRGLPGGRRCAPWPAPSGSTSGPMMAEPKLSSTPPSSRSTVRAKIRKSR